MMSGRRRDYLCARPTNSCYRGAKKTGAPVLFPSRAKKRSGTVLPIAVEAQQLLRAPISVVPANSLGFNKRMLGG
ncbi:hypothetical protein AGR4B_pAt10099 [Agrobacterium tumefaciens str. CFBP 5621]|nr:hypothetical protein AGR4B_pAt10099 [Agrobacterium tumefaciens str. CFBP 5621]